MESKIVFLIFKDMLKLSQNSKIVVMKITVKEGWSEKSKIAIIAIMASMISIIAVVILD